MDKVYLDIVNNYNLHNNDFVVAAISGGPDSMALLDLLLRSSKKIGFQIVCAHVNHNLRKESEFEKIMVEEYCDKNNIIFEYMKIESYNKDNFHNDARKKRYSFFEDVISKYNAKYLFTAHHGDDLAETILMRINRGSTIQGYAGFAKITKKENYLLSRPLINLSKNYLLNYVVENNIPYAKDNSNEKDVYTRNRIRKYIIPKLKEENNNFLDKINQFSETLLSYFEYVDKIVDKEYRLVCSNNKLNIDKFINFEKIIQINILQKWLGLYYGDEIIAINNKHIADLFNLIFSDKVNACINLPKNIIVIKEYNKLLIQHNVSDFSEYNYEFKEIVEIPNGKVIEKIQNFEKNNNYICLLNSKEIKLPLYIRTRKIGDKMEIKGLNGNKKISDIFVNEKIPMKKRKSWPIVTDADNNIVWLPGLKKSKFDKQKNEKYDIILKYH